MRLYRRPFRNIQDNSISCILLLLFLISSALITAGPLMLFALIVGLNVHNLAAANHALEIVIELKLI